MKFEEQLNQPMPTKMGRDKEFNPLYSESQAMFRRLIESAKSGIYMSDLDGSLFYVNHAFVEILGYKTKDDVLGRNLTDELYFKEEDREKFITQMQKVGFVRDLESSCTKKDGTVITISSTSNVVRDEHGQSIGYEGVIHDVTDKRKLEDALLSEKRKLEQLLDFNGKVNSIRCVDELSKFVVQSVAEILEAQKCSIILEDEATKEMRIKTAKGVSEEIIQKTRIKVGEPIAGIVAQDRKPLLVKNIEYEKRFKRANRSTYKTRSFMISPIQLEDKFLGLLSVSDKHAQQTRENVFTETDLNILNSLCRDVAVAFENVSLYQELNLLTVTDPLTHIFNYRQFARSLDHEIKRYKRHDGTLCLMMMDVDHFKTYNDEFGHVEGDTLLRGIGQILKTHLRDVDIICRYAGDEFAVILPTTNIAGAKIAAEKVIKAVNETAFKRKVTVSIGIAEFDEKMSSQDFIRKADEALYDAKRQGRNRVSISPNL